MTLVLLALLAAACGVPAVSTVAPTSPPRPSAAVATTATVLAAATTEPPLSPTPTPVLAAMDRETWTQHSPNGQWTASGLAALPGKGGGVTYYTRLEVTRVDGTQTWTPVDTWGPTGLGYTIPSPLHWARDGQAFYFTNRPHPDGCALLVNGSDLLRLDLETGQVTQLLPQMGLSLALSPDEGRVAYLGYGERGLSLHDLATGAEQTLPFELEAGLSGAPAAQAGLPVWSPAGDRLALTIAHDPCGPPDQRTHSIVVIELTSGEAQIVVARDPRQFVTVEWPAEGRLRLEDSGGALWTLDPGTGVLEAAAH